MKLIKILLITPIFLFSNDYIAVVDFEAINVSVAEAKALTQNLTSEIIALNEFTVVERSAMKRIMEYYGLSKRKKNKATIIEELIMFETNIQNQIIVSRRRRLWHYMEEIKIDNYLSKFVNF